MQRPTRLAALCFCSLLATLTSGQTTSDTAKPSLSKKQLDPRYAISRGPWSAATIALFGTWTALDRNPDRHISFDSPDHKKTIEVIETDVRLHLQGRIFETDLGAKHDAELGWAPDSSKFFVTWTETGELGPWHTQVYRITERGVREIPGVTDKAREDFEQRIRKWPIPKGFDSSEGRQYWATIEYCEPYHVIGSRWLEGSRELVLSVLIRNTGDCRYMSEFNVYRIDAETGTILQRYSAREGHKVFGDKYLPISTTE